MMGKYVYIYSKRYEKPVPELGVYEPNNGFCHIVSVILRLDRSMMEAISALMAVRY